MYCSPFIDNEGKEVGETGKGRFLGKERGESGVSREEGLFF